MTSGMYIIVIEIYDRWAALRQLCSWCCVMNDESRSDASNSSVYRALVLET